MEVWALVMFAVAMAALMLGYPVAFTLGAVAMLFGGIALAWTSSPCCRCASGGS